MTNTSWSTGNTASVTQRELPTCHDLVPVTVVLWALTMLVGGVGNIALSLTIGYSASLMTAMNMYVLTIALGDIVASVVIIPLRVVIWRDAGVHQAVYSTELFLRTCIEVSRLLLMLSLSVERYQSIARPFAVTKAQAKRRAKIAIAFLWAMSLLTAALSVRYFRDTVLHADCNTSPTSVSSTSGSSNSSSATPQTSSNVSSSSNIVLTSDNRPPGWGDLEVYVELPLTFSTILVIAISYSLILDVLRRQKRRMAGHAKPKPKPKPKSKIAPIEESKSLPPSGVVNKAFQPDEPKQESDVTKGTVLKFQSEIKGGNPPTSPGRTSTVSTVANVTTTSSSSQNTNTSVVADPPPKDNCGIAVKATESKHVPDAEITVLKQSPCHAITSSAVGGDDRKSVPKLMTSKQNTEIPRHPCSVTECLPDPSSVDVSQNTKNLNQLSLHSSNAESEVGYQENMQTESGPTPVSNNTTQNRTATSSRDESKDNGKTTYPQTHPTISEIDNSLFQSDISFTSSEPSLTSRMVSKKNPHTLNLAGLVTSSKSYPSNLPSSSRYKEQNSALLETTLLSNEIKTNDLEISPFDCVSSHTLNVEEDECLENLSAKKQTSELTDVPLVVLVDDGHHLDSGRTSQSSKWHSGIENTNIVGKVKNELRHQSNDDVSVKVVGVRNNLIFTTQNLSDDQGEWNNGRSQARPLSIAIAQNADQVLPVDRQLALKRETQTVSRYVKFQTMVRKLMRRRRRCDVVPICDPPVPLPISASGSSVKEFSDTIKDSQPILTQCSTYTESKTRVNKPENEHNSPVETNECNTSGFHIATNVSTKNMDVIHENAKELEASKRVTQKDKSVSKNIMTAALSPGLKLDPSTGKADLATPIKTPEPNSSERVQVVEMDGTVHLEVVKAEATGASAEGAVCLMNPRNREQGRRRVELKAALKVGLLFLCFVFLWLPLPVTVLVMRLMAGWNYPTLLAVLEVLGALATSTAAADPILYGLLNKQIRSAFLGHVKKLKKYVCDLKNRCRNTVRNS
ncbi:uncharacterized protein LOC101846655 [Aplysia californica]|uniref:Uncharacterized protein LOC101846655 n=1 Tax=Aplysia californica TaxID=6500 RepID=A0ABM0JR75_APLCA|nr:uncharacterized protein LOC101846655 [Aplysia californica]XP_035825984.1 uncharacterized protein LOC101846655 [Aplysia californica]